jgi:hypothetical protein
MISKGKHGFMLLFLVFALSGGCKKEATIERIPTLEFVSISESEVIEFTNAVEVVIKFTDGDGDLGSPNPDVNTLRVKDSRLLNYDWYHVPPMTPDLEELQIEGSYTVTLNPLFILGNGDAEEATFTLQIKDRAGNWSNAIVTPSVQIIESE